MRQTITTTAAIIIAATTTANANPTLGGPMSHLLVTLFQNQLFVTFESPSMSTVTMQDAADDFTGPASVLNNTGYNAQFGWLANGFIALPPNSAIFVRTLAASPHINIYDEATFSPIRSTDTSDPVWQWDGTMTHNWYATQVHGTHRVRHEIFVADLDANPLDQYTSATVDLAFEYNPDLSGRIGVIGGPSVGVIPSPAPLTTIALATAVAAGRRRR